MKVVFHNDFFEVYTSDPAAAAGRIQAIYNVIESQVEFVTPDPATAEAILAVHTPSHIESVKQEQLYNISALAAGGAILTAQIGMNEPAFGLIRPPGHHASKDSAWGFCYFSNMAIALTYLKQQGLINTAFVLDIDLHFGDGTVNILGHKNWVKIHNPEERNRDKYIQNIAHILSDVEVDIIGISAGFDHHKEDWGGLLLTQDYYAIGALVRSTARANGKGCFAILEGGYNHSVLGQNALALIEGLDS